MYLDILVFSCSLKSKYLVHNIEFAKIILHLALGTRMPNNYGKICDNRKDAFFFVNLIQHYLSYLRRSLCVQDKESKKTFHLNYVELHSTCEL